LPPSTNVVVLINSKAHCYPFSYYYWSLIAIAQLADQQIFARSDPLSINGKAGIEMSDIQEFKNRCVAFATD
jgi:hypothetical protein